MAGHTGGPGGPRAAGPGVPPVALSHPAMVAAVIAVASVVVLSVSFRIYDTDFWQHLLVGKFIWQTRSFPTAQLWTWPTYGTPDVNATWGFRALIWPFWTVGGVGGLFAWRWLTTLTAFGMLWGVGRRMGARGFAALVVIVLCALVYRLRTQIRPETLVAVLLVAELWLLETHRLGGRNRAIGLVPLAWAWANCHISWYLGFVVMGAYLLGDLRRLPSGDVAARARARRLGIAALAAFAISFVNPWGGLALWQPFEYFLHWRHEPIFQFIMELRPVKWEDYRGSPLPVLVPLWPALIAWRAHRRTFDLVEALLCLFFTTLALLTQRFIGVYALVATPFLMRAVAEWVGARAWPLWSRAPAVRAGLVGLLCGLVAVAEARRADPRPGVAIDFAQYPVRACDYIAERGIRGQGFNNFEYGGYQAWRFWPDRERLPFIDVHQAGTRLDRRLYVAAFRGAEDWQALDARHRFDYILLTRDAKTASHLPDVLDADTSWALVFADDAATVHVRRHGPLAAIAACDAYRHLPGGTAGLGPLGQATATDSVLRSAVATELLRQVDTSPWHSGALSLLANIAMSEGRYDDARRLLEGARKISPRVGRVDERLGRIDLELGRPREALSAFERERERDPNRKGVALLIGQAWQHLGKPERAREWYRRELRRDPGSLEAADSLSALDRRFTP